MLQKSLEVDDGSLILKKFVSPVRFGRVNLHQVVFHYGCKFIIVLALYFGCLLLIKFEEVYASLILDLRLLLRFLMTIGIPTLRGCLGDLRLLWAHLASVQGSLTPLNGQVGLFGIVVVIS
jgi:hypothetical protein